MQFSTTVKSAIPRLQFYDNPPTNKISLQKLEELTLNRLRVLKVIEAAGQDYLKFSDKYEERVYSELNKLGGFGKIFNSPSSTSKNVHDDILNDVTSHFILLVGHCTDETSKRWLIQQEVDLFKYRFMLEAKSPEITKRFLEQSNMSFEVISEEEKRKLRNNLVSANQQTNVDISQFFKVKFYEVPDLVRTRRVFLNSGYAYVPDSELVSLVSMKFRMNLSHNLAKMNLLVLPSIQNEEDRVLPVLKTLTNKFVGEEYVPSKEGTILASNVDQYVKLFPPCMSQVFDHLKIHRHLKHQGRMQFGLFLKAIGMNMDESLKFWRQAFSKIDPGTFNKQYAYNIRHNYGKEGKRVDYTPYSCVKIVSTSAPGPGDCHGCPFKNNDPDILKQRLSNKMSTDRVQTILKYSQERMYHLACREHFRATLIPPTASQDQLAEIPSINHPNQYFDLALQLSKGNLDKIIPKPAQATSANLKKIKIMPKEDFDINDVDLSQVESSYIE